MTVLRRGKRCVNFLTLSLNQAFSVWLRYVLSQIPSKTWQYSQCSTLVSTFQKKKSLLGASNGECSNNCSAAIRSLRHCETLCAWLLERGHASGGVESGQSRPQPFLAPLSLLAIYLFSFPLRR
ncbi:hypothetical protein GGS21DRAFT_512064 [Xylaria nigripes]|nr:hypothetical protein GGS21DRAFT_512064 [Xylaria nigripes]